MDPSIIVAIVAGVVAIVTSSIAIWNQQREARSRRHAERTVASVSAEVDKTKIVVKEWQNLYDALRQQVRELRVEIAECDKERDDLKHEVDRLRWKVERLEAASGPPT